MGTRGDGPANTEQARAAWRQLRDLVLERDRRRGVAEALGMSFQRVKALRLLAGRELAHHELAAELAIDKPYATVIIRDLIGRGLVESRPHPQDGRSKIVSITRAGQAVAQRAERMLTEPPAELVALGEADLADLNRILGLLGAG